MLRHVGITTASVWVQTDRPGTVSVLGCEARTFEVAGHHFALVQVAGLPPGSRIPYQVHLDGEQVWPPPVSPFPPSTIPTRDPDQRRHRVVFGSCRYPKLADARQARRLGIDALDAYAARMARQPVEQWPDALLLLGDQIYADELTPRDQRRIAERVGRPPDWPATEIVGFDEFAGMYRDTWSDPEVRWLMSTVPVAMIFDDHDVRDDWNTSAAWRATIARKPWWRDRIRAALASYWVFQHLGNLPPDELAGDTDYQRILAADGDTWPLLAELADRADAGVEKGPGVRFSFRWDLGRCRFVMIDTRNGRVLTATERKMLGEEEFSWVERQVTADGAVDHLLIGSSLPWLLPHAIHEAQAVNEAAARRPGWRGRFAEWLRQLGDLEHWAAFWESFDRLTDLIARAARGTGGHAPASISVLSGDVHHSYAARARLHGDPPAAVYQLTCSPVHQRVPSPLRPLLRAGWAPGLHALLRGLARRAGVPPPGVSWERIAGPMFGNMVATLEIDDRSARVTFERPRSASSLAVAAQLTLSNGSEQNTSEEAT